MKRSLLVIGILIQVAFNAAILKAVQEPAVNTSTTVYRIAEKGEPFTFEDFTPEQLAKLKVKGDKGESTVSTNTIKVEHTSTTIIDRPEPEVIVKDGLNGTNGTNGLTPQFRTNPISGNIETRESDESFWSILWEPCKWLECKTVARP